MTLSIWAPCLNKKMYDNMFNWFHAYQNVDQNRYFNTIALRLLPDLRHNPHFSTMTLSMIPTHIFPWAHEVWSRHILSHWYIIQGRLKNQPSSLTNKALITRQDKSHSLKHALLSETTARQCWTGKSFHISASSHKNIASTWRGK